MMNFRQLRELFDSVAREMPTYSSKATDLFMMAVAHESHGGAYLRQNVAHFDHDLHALGIIQMERRTHDSLWAHGDGIRDNAEQLGVYKHFKALEYDLKYNAFMFRSWLLTDPAPLPQTYEQMAEYLKRRYNTTNGAARPQDYLNAFLKWSKK